MIRRIACLATLAASLFASPAGAQQAAKIHMHSDSGYAADGVLFAPADGAPVPGILLIPGDWGLTASIVEQGRRLANAGYVVVAIDLYRGEVAADEQRAALLARTLPSERALQDLAAAVGFLRAQPNVRPDEIGVIGWSFGSGYALEVARRLPVHAVVLNGAPAIEAMPSAAARVPVLGNFGGRDCDASPSRIRALQRALSADGVAVDFKVYRHAGRDFDSTDRPGFRVDEARDAERRTLTFLAATLAR